MSDLLADRLAEAEARLKREVGRERRGEWFGWGIVACLTLGAAVGLYMALTATARDADRARTQFWRHQETQEVACRAAGGFPIVTWGSYKDTEGPVYSGCMPVKAER